MSFIVIKKSAQLIKIPENSFFVYQNTNLFLNQLDKQQWR